MAQDEVLPVDQLGFAECNARELVALWFADKAWNFGCEDFSRGCVRLKANMTDGPKWAHQLTKWERRTANWTWTLAPEVRCLAGAAGETEWATLEAQAVQRGLQHASDEVRPADSS